MHTLVVETVIHASPQRCFDLARSVDAHLASAQATGERAVAGTTTGLLELDDEVTWEARHLGLRWRLTSRITAFDPPRFFQDRQQRGPFASFEHDHAFEPIDAGRTRMIDTLRFAAPGAWLGWPIGRWVLKPHLRRFIERRGQSLAEAAMRETHSIW